MWHTCAPIFFFLNTFGCFCFYQWHLSPFVQKEALSTSHYSQPNTIEYEMAMEWCWLQSISKLWWKKFYKVWSSISILNIIQNSIAAFIAFKLLNWLCWIRKGTRGGVEKTQGQSQVEVSTSVVSSNFSWWVPTKEDSSSSNYCMIKLLLSFLARSISTIEMDVLSFWFFSTD